MQYNQALQNRFLRNGLSSFDQLEMMEFLLSLRVDKKSHRRFAQELTKKYKSLNDIIDESNYELEKIPGFQKQYLVGLKLPYHVANIYLFEKSKERPVTSNPDAVYNYLKHSMRGYKNECFKILYLNNSNKIIRNEIMFNGTIDQAPVYPREIIKSALSYDAAGLILAHNHPSGNPGPSDADINITKHINDASKLMGITLHDHIIVAEDKYYSFAKEGFLKKFNY